MITAQPDDRVSLICLSSLISNLITLLTLGAEGQDYSGCYKCTVQKAKSRLDLKQFVSIENPVIHQTRQPCPHTLQSVALVLKQEFTALFLFFFFLHVINFSKLMTSTLFAFENPSNLIIRGSKITKVLSVSLVMLVPFCTTSFQAKEGYTHVSCNVTVSQ